MEGICLNLIEATVTLYPANADGTPQLASPLFTGAAAENLQLMERWLKKTTNASGSRYPKNHPLVAQHGVTIGRLWALPDASVMDWAADFNQYVLDILWVEEESLAWHRKTYYGVTISEHGWDAKDVENGLVENQIFDAQYVVPASGPAGSTPPAIGSVLPYRVIYTDATGSSTLYTYDPASHQFTGVADPTGKATISYTAGAFAVQFAADTSPVLATTVNGLNYRNHSVYRNSNGYCPAQFLVRGGIFAGVPSPAELPKLEFFYGATRVATITQAGLYDVEFDEVEPALVDGVFGIYAGSNLIATLSSGAVDAKNFIVV